MFQVGRSVSLYGVFARSFNCVPWLRHGLDQRDHNVQMCGVIRGRYLYERMMAYKSGDLVSLPLDHLLTSYFPSPPTSAAHQSF